VPENLGQRLHGQLHDADSEGNGHCADAPISLS
jgi:hypothetical protein